MKYEIRELGIGGILDQAIKLVKDNFWMFLKVVLVLSVPFSIVMNWLILSSASENALLLQQEMAARPGQSVTIGSAFGSTGLQMLVYLLLYFFVVWPLTDVAINYSIGNAYLGKPIGLGAAYRRAGAVYLKYIWTGFLFSICIFGLAILYGIGVGVAAMAGPIAVTATFIALGLLFLIVVVRFGLFGRVVIFEGLSGSKALNRSKDLVKSSFWTAVLLWILILVIKFACAYAIQYLEGHAALYIALEVVTDSILTIFGAAAVTVLYFSCRCKRENFDLTMLADAVATDDAPTS